MIVYPVDWSASDVQDPETETTQYRIRAVGKTPEGLTAIVDVDFFPYFFVQVPEDWSTGRLRLFLADASSKLGALARYSTPVKRKTLWGFTNGQTRTFVQLAFSSLAAAKRARYKLVKTHKTFEASVDPVVRFFHIRGISPASWIQVPDPTDCPFDSIDKYVRCSFLDVSSADFSGQPPLVFASWDIEVYSESGKFPLADNPGDKIIQIATSFQRYGEAQPYRTLVVTLDTCDDVPGVDIVSVASEADVVNEWIRNVCLERTDVLLGYNTHQFDWRYVYGRSLVCLDDDTAEPLIDLQVLSRSPGDDRGGHLREFELNSGAYGQNKFVVIQTPGVLQIDLLQVMRREHKLDSYSLNSVAAKFLGDAKIDLPAARIFECFRGSSADRATIAEYAAKDTLLPLQLLSKLCIFENFTEMANAVTVPLEYLMNRGQQVHEYQTQSHQPQSHQTQSHQTQSHQTQSHQT